MRKICLQLFVLFFATVFNSELKAQTSVPTTLKDWQRLGESRTHVDVFYRIVKCDGKDQIHLKIFSENYEDQAVSFDITVTNKFNQEKFSKTLNATIQKLQQRQADCGTESNDLKIVIPESYYSLNLDVKLSFNQ